MREDNLAYWPEATAVSNVPRALMKALNILTEKLKLKYLLLGQPNFFEALFTFGLLFRIPVLKTVFL